jgi:hypothetical protein
MALCTVNLTLVDQSGTPKSNIPLSYWPTGSPDANVQLQDPVPVQSSGTSSPNLILNLEQGRNYYYQSGLGSSGIIPVPFASSYTPTNAIWSLGTVNQSPPSPNTMAALPANTPAGNIVITGSMGQVADSDTQLPSADGSPGQVLAIASISEGITVLEYVTGGGGGGVVTSVTNGNGLTLSGGGNLSFSGTGYDAAGSAATAQSNAEAYTASQISGLSSIYLGIGANAVSATVLATPRTINGVSFNGSANVTITAAASTLTGTTLASNVVNSSLTSLGTIGTGVWQGTPIAAAYVGSLSAVYLPLAGGALSGNLSLGGNQITNVAGITSEHFSLTDSSGAFIFATGGELTDGGSGAIVINGTSISSGGVISGYATLASPAFTGVPAAPTATGGTNTTQLATCAFVHSAVSGLGSGTVTSVALALPSSVFTISGSPVSTSGTLTGTLATQSANLIWAGPGTGSAAAPTFRALVTADMPSGTGTVTSVGLTGISGIVTVGSSPVTTSGTMTLALANQSANLVFAGPSTGSAAAPTFRSLASADIPDLSATYLLLAGGMMSGNLSMNGHTLTSVSGIVNFASSLVEIGSGSITFSSFARLDTTGLYHVNVAQLAIDSSGNFFTVNGVKFCDTLGLQAGAISAGTVPTARLGSGTAYSSTYLRGDQTWAAVSGGSGTVTSVDLAVPNWLGLAGDPITTAGTITISEVASVGQAALIAAAMHFQGV